MIPLLCRIGFHDLSWHGPLLSCGCGRWTRERCRHCDYMTPWRDGAENNPQPYWCYGCKEPTP